MRKLIALTTFFAPFFIPAFAVADTFEHRPNVTKAVIFGQGSTVTRSAAVSIPTGRHQIHLILPSTQNHFGIQPELAFDGPNAPRIVSTRLLQNNTPALRRDPSAETLAARNALQQAETRLRIFDEDLDAAKGAVATAQMALTLLQNLSDKPAKLVGDQAPLSGQALADLLVSLQEQSNAAHVTLTKARTKVQTLQQQRPDLVQAVQDAKQNLGAVEEPNQTYAIFAIDVAANVPFTGDLSISQREPIFWQPSYIVDLTQKGDEGRLSLKRQAIIHRAGNVARESWQDVSITLSTAQFDAPNAVFGPWPMIKGLVDANQRRKQISVQSSPRATADAMMPEPVVEEAGMAAPSVNFSGQTVTFDLGDGHDFPWQADQLLFEIDTLNFPVDLYALSLAQSGVATLYTDFENTTGGLILSGQGQLYRDGTLISRINLPQFLPGQTEPLGLGPLYGLQIERQTLNVTEGDSGFLTTSNDIERSYRTTLTSTLDYKITARLLDVVPTSEDEDLQITTTASPRPSETNFDGKRGVLAWDIPMSAGASTTVEFGYRMRWPEGKIVIDK